MGWINVKDKLPDAGYLVLGAVYHTDLIFPEGNETIMEAIERCQKEAEKHPRVEPCYYDLDGWNTYDGFPMVCAPSFWMEIPDPPEYEEELRDDNTEGN